MVDCLTWRIPLAKELLRWPDVTEQTDQLEFISVISHIFSG